MDCYSLDDGVAQISPPAGGGGWRAAPVGGLRPNPINLLHDSSSSRNYQLQPGSVDSRSSRVGIVPEPLIEYRTAPASSNVTSMTKRLDLMRFLIAKHRDLYAAHIADAILGVEAISMSRLAMWESLMRGDTTASQAFMTHPTYGDGGMAAAVRLQS